VTDPSHTTQPPLARWAGETFTYLTTTGRQTGKPHRIEIWFAIEDERVYLLSGGRGRADWVRNLQANPTVTIELGTETFTGIARILQPETPDDRRARDLLVTKYRKGNDLDDWGRNSLPVVVDITGVENAGPK
jgi:deazaflavin-dependent oxidoreductase (nitroreductase family)